METETRRLAEVHRADAGDEVSTHKGSPVCTGSGQAIQEAEKTFDAEDARNCAQLQQRKGPAQDSSERGTAAVRPFQREQTERPRQGDGEMLDAFTDLHEHREMRRFQRLRDELTKLAVV